MSAIADDMNRGLARMMLSRLQVDEPGQPQPLAKISDRDRTILAALAEHRYLTTSMITALCWGRRSSRARVRLHQLYTAHYIRRFRPVTSAGAQTEWAYELDTRGARLIGIGDWSIRELHDFAYAEHDLELNAMLINLLDRHAEETGATGRPLLDTAPFTWNGDRTSAILPRREARPLAANTKGDLPPSATVRSGQSVEGIVDPDAVLRGVDQHGDPIAAFIEYDRTRRASKLTSKLQRYDWLVTDGWRRTSLALMADPPIVLFITKHEAQLPHLIQHASEVLDAHVTYDDGRDASYPGRNQIGFTSAERLEAHDDRIHICGPSPEPTERTARTVRFPIHRAFRRLPSATAR